jgi:uncharacterized lipoprotein YajG
MGAIGMTEQENAETGSQGRHPIVRLIIENPISALNTAAILFGGGFVYASNESRMEKMETRVVAMEQRIREDNIAATVKDDRATQKVEVITRDLNDVKVAVRGIEASVQFLVRQVQQQDRRGPQ